MASDSISGGLRPWVEWAIWLILAATAWTQTGYFDQEIAEYRFGASGWPRALCIVLALGATGQLLLNLRNRQDEDDVPEAGVMETGIWTWVQRIGIFTLPLVYLYLMPTMGFYVLTPVFIIGLLILLEVWRIVPILAVTAIVYGLVLLIFTRLFYVALPTGSAAPFYDWNNALIVFARIGL